VVRVEPFVEIHLQEYPAFLSPRNHLPAAIDAHVKGFLDHAVEALVKNVQRNLTVEMVRCGHRDPIEALILEHFDVIRVDGNPKFPSPLFPPLVVAFGQCREFDPLCSHVPEDRQMTLTVCAPANHANPNHVDFLRDFVAMIGAVDTGCKPCLCSFAALP